MILIRNGPSFENLKLHSYFLGRDLMPPTYRMKEKDALDLVKARKKIKDKKYMRRTLAA